MKRMVMASLGATLGAAAVAAGIAWAASPQVDAAIKAVEAVGADPGKLKLFCELNRLLADAGDRDDPKVEKQIDNIMAQMGADFSAAWDIGDELNENSPDGQEFYAAVDALADKCQ